MAAPECGANWRKPAAAVTDRAARYRAHQRGCRPPGPPICAFCGGIRNVEVHHVDGHEENTEPANLTWCCRSCNTAIGFVMKCAGIGRRTKQYNPAAQGARSLGQWVAAVLSMKGESHEMEPAAAIEIIHATPPEQRSQFAKRIWRIRRERGTDRRAKA